MPAQNRRTQTDDATLDCACAIAGGGPAGLMLGLLLARAGVETIVLEKHADFLRDFRGDTIHPSTLETMAELGLLDALLDIPHTRALALHAEIGGRDVIIADFSRLPARCRFIAFMPQWEFLNFLAQEAAGLPNFRLIMQAEVDGLIEEEGRVAGLRARTPAGPVEIRAALTVGADGRNSAVRQLAGLEADSFGAPSDVLWIKLSRQADDPPYVMGHGGPRQGFVMIDRGDFWQCGHVISKGGFDAVKHAGLPAFRAAVAAVSPLPAERMDEIRSWDDVHLLSIRIDRLRRWSRPGLLCIGDAAHAMSPIGGFGVNLAIQDAVAAANRLAGPLLRGDVRDSDLAGVQARRRFPTWATQKLQLMMQRPRGPRDVEDKKRSGPPPVMGTIARWPFLAHVSGRLVGLGFRREHVG